MLASMSCYQMTPTGSDVTLNHINMCDFDSDLRVQCFGDLVPSSDEVWIAPPLPHPQQRKYSENTADALFSAN